MGSTEAREAPASPETSQPASMLRLDASYFALAVFWCAAFVICLGLGYQHLNRYDPRTELGTSDSADYTRLVVQGIPEQANHRSFRILIPYIARPIYWVVRGRVGTWDPVLLALLVVNSALVATTMLALYALARWYQVDAATSLLAACIYPLNFFIPNSTLVALVDAGENCVLLLLPMILTRRSWWMMLPLGILGALAKESSILLGCAMAGAWWLVTFRSEAKRWRMAMWIAAMAIGAAATMSLVRFLGGSENAAPGAIAGGLARRSVAGSLVDAVRMLKDVSFWYGLAWCAPLGIWRIGRLPRTWVAGSLCAAAFAMVLGGFTGCGGSNTGRYVFAAMGGPLTLAAAMMLRDLLGRTGWQRPAVQA